MFKFLQGVTFKGRIIHFNKTGADIPVDKNLLIYAWKISSLHTLIKIVKLWQKVRGNSPGKTITFLPQRAGPWYNARIAAELAGYRVIDNAEKADYQFAFSDETFSNYRNSSENALRDDAINLHATDISKSNVGKIFHEVFGYGVSVDPTTFSGPCVAKSESNATHDGKILSCPIPTNDVKEGYAYQKLIPTGQNPEKTEDLRVLYVMNKLVVIFHKFKNKEERFGVNYLDVIPKHPTEVFSTTEINKITDYCQSIGLDFGALDILRSTDDGLIYIVDVNKTGMPVLCLSLKTQYKAFRKIAQQFRTGLEAMPSNKAKGDSCTYQ